MPEWRHVRRRSSRAVPRRRPTQDFFYRRQFERELAAVPFQLGNPCFQRLLARRLARGECQLAAQFVLVPPAQEQALSKCELATDLRRTLGTALHLAHHIELELAGMHPSVHRDLLLVAMSLSLRPRS